MHAVLNSFNKFSMQCPGQIGIWMHTQEISWFCKSKFWLSSIRFRVRVGVLAHEKLIANVLFLFNTSWFIWNHSEMSWRVTFIVLYKSLYLEDFPTMLVSSTYSMVCESSSIISGRSFIHIYWTELGPGQNLEELHALLSPNLTEISGMLCSLRILAVFYHVR